ncbi:MAG: tetratricopeptide repeat protein [Magnetococcales bacterium]|nr:tetratricopeptide repeat protein [Magnetococcales bacterium]NGZ07600.1 tetratricopeptide repeat protein [Magnetococcales bacterium]
MRAKSPSRTERSKRIASAVALFQAGQHQDALLLAEQILTTDPEHPILLELAARSAGQLQRLDQADSFWHRLLRTQPDHADSHNNRGVVLLELQRYIEAEAAFREAVRLNPESALFCNNLGLALRKQQQHAAAAAIYRTALNIQPEAAEIWCHLGNALQELQDFTGAETAYRTALHHQPALANAHYNLGILLKKLRRHAEAEAALRTTLHLQPQAVDAALNLGLLLLTQGRFSEGWPLYACRHHPNRTDEKIIPPALPCPPWSGGNLAGISLIVVAEQGFGDTLQFCRYLPEIKKRGVNRLTVMAPPPLLPLLTTLHGVDAFTPPAPLTPLPPHDFWMFLLDLPLHLGTTLETIPAQLPYLDTDPERLACWRAQMPTHGVRVGLVWKGYAHHKNDRNRSLPTLSTLAPLWEIPGVTFISLQKDAGEQEAAQPPDHQPLLHLGEQIRDFADSAAIVAQLDLVICVDTAIAHLCGALNRNCWVLLPAMETDWRWLEEREESPWYPGVMRLFRQRKAGEWTEVVDRIAQELRCIARPDFQSELQTLFSVYRQGKLSETLELATRLLMHHPDHVELLNLAAICTHRLGNTLTAETMWRRCLELKPGFTDVLNNLGSMYQERLQFAEAEDVYQEALRLRPDFVDLHYNLGLMLKRLRRYPEAEAAYREALRLKPDHIETGFNLGLLLLTQGRYQEGWPLYALRYHPERGEERIAKPKLTCPEWQGEPLTGRSLVVVIEQGFGDSIQFCRYLPLLKQRGADHLTLLCDPPLLRLFQTLSGVDTLATPDQIPHLSNHDFWTFLLNIPRHLGTTLETIPATIPYLHPDPERLALWRDRIVHGRWRIGVVWKGYAQHKNDPHRSLPNLGTLAPLWTIPDTRFISLQKGAGEEEAATPPATQPLLHLGGEIQDFADSAAIIAHLDLVICVDTAIAHLCGALGKPCWVLLPAMGTDWRWLDERSDSPWYPGVMRLFRQQKNNDWTDVISRVSTELTRLTHSRQVIMHEQSKAAKRRFNDGGFHQRWFVGHGIDIGGKPDPLSQYQGIFRGIRSVRIWDLEDGDAQYMPNVADASYDFVHASHSLEHMVDVHEALHHWIRIVKPGGHLVITVPDEDLYEQGHWPSRFNADHKWSFTIHKPGSWSPRSINILDLARHFSAQVETERMERILDFFRPELLSRNLDQTLTPVAECAIEWILRKRLQPLAP